jgi:hypothetical protein
MERKNLFEVNGIEKLYDEGQYEHEFIFWVNGYIYGEIKTTKPTIMKKIRQTKMKMRLRMVRLRIMRLRIMRLRIMRLRIMRLRIIHKHLSQNERQKIQIKKKNMKIQKML